MHTPLHTWFNILQDLKKKEGSDGDALAAEITDGSATKAGDDHLYWMLGSLDEHSPWGLRACNKACMVTLQCSAPCTLCDALFTSNPKLRLEYSGKVCFSSEPGENTML